jgi:hypothetical protein
MKKKILWGLMMLFGMLMTTTLTACSSDDDDNVETVSGAEQAQLIREALKVYAPDFYVVNSESDVYYCTVSSASEVQGVVQSITRSSWDGTSTQTITLNDNYGTVRIVAQPETGIYASVQYNIKSAANITVKVTSEEYVNSDNGESVGPHKNGKKDVLDPDEDAN